MSPVSSQSPSSMQSRVAWSSRKYPAMIELPRQNEPASDVGLARYAARANVVAERRRIAHRLFFVARDQVEPGERPPREILGLEIIDRHLVGDHRHHAADQAHIVIEGKPGNAA